MIFRFIMLVTHAAVSYVVRKFSEHRNTSTIRETISALKMEFTYQTARCHKPKDNNKHLHNLITGF